MSGETKPKQLLHLVLGGELSRLGEIEFKDLDRLDIVLIHDCDPWTHGHEEAPVRFKEAMEGAYKALDKLRNEKTIKAIGFGINEADTCVRFANVMLGTDACTRWVATNGVVIVGTAGLTQFSSWKLCISCRDGVSFHVSFPKILFCSYVLGKAGSVPG